MQRTVYINHKEAGWMQIAEMRIKPKFVQLLKSLSDEMKFYIRLNEGGLSSYSLIRHPGFKVESDKQINSCLKIKGGIDIYVKLNYLEWLYLRVRRGETKIQGLTVYQSLIVLTGFLVFGWTVYTYVKGEKDTKKLEKVNHTQDARLDSIQRQIEKHDK